MLIGFIKHNRAASIVLVPVALILYWIHGFIHPVPPPAEHTAPLYNVLLIWLGAHAYIQLIISFILVICESLLLNYIVEKTEILPIKTYLPALIYASLMSLQPEMLSLHPILIANLFMLFALHKTLQSYRKETAYADFFDIGLFISLAVLFYFPSAIFILFIWISLLVLRPFVWREWIISLLGFTVPWLYLVFAYFWNDKLNDLQYEVVYYTIIAPAKSFNSIKFTYADYSQVGLLILSAVFSIGKLLGDLNKKTVRIRSYLLLLIYFFLIATASIFLAPSYSIVYLSFLSVPFSVFFSTYLLTAKRVWLAEMLMALFILSIIFNQIVS